VLLHWVVQGVICVNPIFLEACLEAGMVVVAKVVANGCARKVVVVIFEFHPEHAISVSYVMVFNFLNVGTESSKFKCISCFVGVTPSSGVLTCAPWVSDLDKVHSIPIDVADQ